MAINFSKSVSTFRHISVVSTTIIMEFICKLKHAFQICLSCYAQKTKIQITSFVTQKHLLDIRCTTLLALSDTVERGFSLQGEFGGTLSQLLDISLKIA
jgi:hypothetical protein